MELVPSDLDEDMLTESGTATASCTDLAGTIVTASVDVLIDKTPPVQTSTQSPEPNAYGWNNTDVVVRWTCGDAESGVDPAEGDLADDLMGRSGTAMAVCTDAPATRTWPITR